MFAPYVLKKTVMKIHSELIYMNSSSAARMLELNSRMARSSEWKYPSKMKVG